MIDLPDKWAPFLRMQPETGMGYWICTVETADGQSFERVIIDSGKITKCNGSRDIPFDVTEISRIIVTHDKSERH